MDLNDKLLNVRRATRLLASYYRRVMTILGMVERTLEQRKRSKLKFHYWSSTHHRNMGKQSTNPMGRFGWDFLPMGDAYFMWTSGGGPRPEKTGSVLVFAQHVTDDAFAKADDGTEPDPGTFAPADESGTWFDLYAYALARGTCADTWWAVSGAAEAQLDDDRCWDGEIQTIDVDALEGTSADCLIQYWGHRVSMAELATEDDVEAKVLAPLRHALERLVIPPER